MATNLSVDEFTKRFGDFVISRFPGAKINRRAGDTIEFLMPDGVRVEISTGNIHKEAQHLKEKEEAAFERTLKAITPANDIAASTDPLKVIPLVRSSRWLASLASAPNAIYSEKLAADLVVVYAHATGEHLRTLEKKTLAELGMSAPRQAALKNFLKITPPPEIIHADGIWGVAHGGTTESSFLVHDEFWRARASELGGEIVAVVPNRDTLWYVGTKDARYVEILRKMALDSYENNAYPLSKSLIVYRDGRWNEFVK